MTPCVSIVQVSKSQNNTLTNDSVELILVLCRLKVFQPLVCCSYVVDAADPDNLSVSKSELHDLLSKSSLSGIPLLVLGNKIDKPGALSKQALTDEM